MALTADQMEKLTRLKHLQSLAARTKVVTDDLQAQINALDSDTVHSVSIAKDDTAQTGYAASYTISVNDSPLATKINIPKDFLVKSATMEICQTADVPISGLKPGDPYLDFVINTVDASETAQHVYINVADLVDVYTPGNGIDITNNAISVVVDQTNANGLSVGANGLAMAVATDSVTGAMSATDHAAFTADNAKLALVSAEANKTTVTTEKAGTIEIDGVSKTIVEFATDAEVEEMIDAALPAPTNP